MACGSKEKTSTTPRYIEAKPVWFDVPPRFSFKSPEGEKDTHAFFDLSPYKTKEDDGINYFLLTPKGSEYGYDLDLVSGKPVRKYRYCEQTDVWKKYGGDIERPPYSEGVIPRLLDQINEPQKIWVFGSPTYLVKERGEFVYSQRARVVGGVVLQYCDNYPCVANSQWLSRMVLIGVNDDDPNMQKIKTLSELKKKVRWAYVKAFAQNGYGRAVNGNRDEPAYRLVGEIDAPKALDFAFKKGHYFSFKEINSLRKNCFHLYDYMWKKSLEVRKNMRQKVTKEKKSLADITKQADRLNKLRNFGLSTVISDERYEVETTKAEKQIKETRVSSFINFFNYFYKDYGERFRTCIRFVRPSTVNDNLERHWFFSYLANFFYLEKVGYYFSCNRGSWVENPILQNGKRRFDLNAPRNCSSKVFDSAFDMGVTVMAGLANGQRDHFKYLTYDFGEGGSHYKVYSWVFFNGKKLSCSEKQEEKKREALIFPTDVTWKPFTLKSGRGRYDIIR